MAQAGFITDDFLLQTSAARRLYHDYAERLPIIDYHCHLPPDQVARDHRFANLTQLWLYGDHYKWRAMRTNGIDERYCTGDASDFEKFCKWAETMPRCLRNPLYHWTHLELSRYFGISDRLLSPATAQSIWDECNARLARPEYSCRGLIKQSNVALVCTTDDPVDTLEHHQAIVGDKSFGIPVLPAWRPDRAMNVNDAKEFQAYVDRLAAAADIDITGFTSFLSAIRKRHAYFHANGCRMSDHGLETVSADDFTEKEVAAVFAKVRSGTPVAPAEARKFESAMLYEFGIMDHEKGWTQQYHLGALRNNNSRMFARMGRDIGFDSMGDLEVARPLSRLLDRLDRTNQLARTIVYNLNPRDNALMVSMIGNFQDGSVPGKIQYGSAWWFLDQKDGMERQIEDLSQMGLLSRFVGMLTDSRSFISYTRHEYFRRILCNILGHDMEAGLVPMDFGLVGGMVRDISYNNAAGYFGFDLPRIG
jgi:glucuronate isomerase